MDSERIANRDHELVETVTNLRHAAVEHLSLPERRSGNPIEHDIGWWKLSVNIDRTSRLKRKLATDFTKVVSPQTLNAPASRIP